MELRFDKLSAFLCLALTLASCANVVLTQEMHPTPLPSRTPTIAVVEDALPSSSMPTAMPLVTPLMGNAIMLPFIPPTPLPGGGNSQSVWLYTQFFDNSFTASNVYFYSGNDSLSMPLFKDTNNYYGSPNYIPSLGNPGRLAFVSNLSVPLENHPSENLAVFFVNTGLPPDEEGQRVTTPIIDLRRIRYAPSEKVFATICEMKDLCFINSNLRVNRYIVKDEAENIKLVKLEDFADDAPDTRLAITTFDWLSDNQVVFTVAVRQEIFNVELTNPDVELLPETLFTEVYRNSLYPNEILLDLDAASGSPGLLMLVKRHEDIGPVTYAFQVFGSNYAWQVPESLIPEPLPGTPPLQIQWGSNGTSIAFTARSETPIPYLGAQGGQLEADCALGCLFILDTQTGEFQQLFDLGFVREFWWGAP